ncbi:HalOD1 output domain-containing protein [Halosimplex halobium]|uniref:HalOD1 output domain-containing protein n=1 Tax=Halosimplex halobium TaxID=3396618 RepID=UPI003F55F43D
MDRPEPGQTWEVGRNECASDAVFRALADVSDRPLTELPPLQESIDVDSLDHVLAVSSEIQSLTFEYAGYEIVVEPARIRLRERS